MGQNLDPSAGVIMEPTSLKSFSQSAGFDIRSTGGGPAGSSIALEVVHQHRDPKAVTAIENAVGFLSRRAVGHGFALLGPPLRQPLLSNPRFSKIKQGHLDVVVGIRGNYFFNPSHGMGARRWRTLTGCGLGGRLQIQRCHLGSRGLPCAGRELRKRWNRLRRRRTRSESGHRIPLISYTGVSATRIGHFERAE